MLNPIWRVFEKKNFTKIKEYAGMAKPMVIDLAVEEAFQGEIKDTLEHNNLSYDEWYAQTDKEKNNTSFSWTYMLVSMV